MAFNRKQSAYVPDLFVKKGIREEVNESIKQFVYEMPGNFSTDQRQMILRTLLKSFRENDKLVSLLNNPTALQQLAEEVIDQVKQEMASSPSSKKGLFEILGGTMVGAKLNGIFPGLGIFAGLITGSAAQTYSYFVGQPQGGEDLCVNAMGDCIQGYLAYLNKTWTSELPQAARVFQSSNPDAKACISHDGLATMLYRAYMGPSNQTAECILEKPLQNNQSVEVIATKVDQVTCNIMEDSLTGLASRCGESTSTRSAKLIVGDVMIGVCSAALLGIIAFGIYKCCEMRKENLNSKEDSKTYGSIV